MRTGPDHDEHDSMLRWVGGTFDPEAAAVEEIDVVLERLAKRRAPRPRKPKPS